MLAPEAQKEFDQLMGMAAHDLVEPLRKMQVFGSRLHGLLEGSANDEAKMFLNKVLQNAQSMNYLVDQLHIYSRIHRKAEATQIIDLNFLLSTLLNEEPSLATLRIENSPLPKIQMAWAHARELFKQIAHNTLKFAKEETPSELNISASNIIEKNGHYLLLQFADKGIGIGSGATEKIFTPFSRLHSKQTYPGAGLGLAIVQQIALHYEGLVQAENNTEGTTIKIYLPQKLLVS